MNYWKSFCLFIFKASKRVTRKLNYIILTSLFPVQSQKDHVTIQRRTLEVLSSLSYRTGELKEYLKLIASSVSELLDLDWTVVTLCQDGFERILASSIDMNGDFQASLHGTITEFVVNSGKGIYVKDTSIDKRYGEPPEGYCAYLGVPLRLPTGMIIGTICSFHRQPRDFTDEDMRLVEIFAERAATAIDNYNLCKDQQKMIQQLYSEIRERQDVELALKKSEEQLRQIAENLEPLVWMYSHDGQPIYMSPMFEKMWGIPVEEWYKNSRVCLDAIHPDDRAYVSEAFTKVFTHSGNYNLEYRIIRPDGNIRIIRDRAFQIIDDAGKIYRVAGIAEDITERQQEQERSLRALERLSEIGELATTIVHEIRNPLTTVLMGLNFFQRMELPENAKKRLTLSLHEAERLKRLLNEILLYAKQETFHPTPVDLNEIAIDVVENISTSQVAIGKQIIFDPLPEPLIVLGDQDKLRQVMINLLQNACEATEIGGQISLCFLSPNESKQIYIQFQNYGDLIPSESIPKLTKPFFTTKPSGNGLGLAIVKKIVEVHGGRLEITSTEVSGTVVSVILPML
ncbi:MAG: histidine kinase [Pseudanabaena sp.]|nr:MAG: histidine kinase [Pseudanabaena sp.]